MPHRFFLILFSVISPCLGLTPSDFVSLELYDKALPGLEQQWEQGDLTIRAELAKTYYHLGKWEKVLSILEDVQGESEKHLLALALHQLQRSDEALKLFQDLPQTPTVVFDHATVLFETGKWEQARALFTSIKGSFEEHALLSLVKIHLVMQEYQEAENLLNAFNPQNNESAAKERLFLLGDLALRRGDYSQSIFWLEQALPKRNLDLASWTDQTVALLGKAYIKSAEKIHSNEAEKAQLLSKAEKIHLKASAQYQKDIQGQMLILLGDYAYLEGIRRNLPSLLLKSANYYAEAQTLVSHEALEAVILKEIRSLNQEGSNASLNKSLELIQKLNDSPALTLLKAEISLKEGRISPSQVIQLLKEQALPFEFRDAQCDFLGNVLFEEARFTEALEQFDWILQNCPHSTYFSNALYWSGRIYEIQGAPQDKIGSYYRMLYEKYPQSRYAAEAYFFCFDEQQYLLGNKSSMKHLQAFKEHFPDSPYLLRALYLIGLDHLRDRRSPEGKWLSRKNLTDAISAFYEVEATYDQFFRNKKLSEKDLAEWSALKHQATVERAKANLTIALESKGAKRQIYLNYAHDVFLELISQLSQREDSIFWSVEEEARFYLALTDKEKGDLARSCQVLQELQEKYISKDIKQSYFFAKSYELLARIALEEERLAMAIGYYDKALEAGAKDLLPTDEHLSLLIDKASAWRKIGDYDQAMCQLSEVVNYPVISSKRLKAMYLRARIYADQGRKALARKQLESLSLKGGEWAKKARQTLDQEFGYD